MEQKREPLSPIDACTAPSSFSLSRFALIAVLFVTILGSGVLFAVLDRRTAYGIQIPSQIAYTALVILYTFSSNRGGNQRYLFRCTFVRPQLPRLAFRHIGFLAVLFVLQTSALRLRPRLSPSWFVVGGPKDNPFDLTLTFLCFVLAFIEVLTNRSSLDGAHPKVNLSTDR